ncbi:uncharacterized protein PITG_19240 [Phytophthora infestans T30-4]|uniref:Uncharacterized protein n=1 Tax=Phytophthora infestans (strain T30-4) TaxID=403677 RepID=D0NZS9_PHYIT|nr:uncharacterized protein PITG_19240 [Phytophthora infestans T30-4]EEY69644.1 conserved hypothetical protein [Phytophthora infestans T30-4]|eukprot:XP_002997143.1 conserved hypothetical protein [Phytophthora infestans T30-4]
MATRNALPLTNPATLMYIREKTAATNAEMTTNSANGQPRKSTARFSRKMKELLSGKKAEREQGATDLPAKKSPFYRQFVEARAFVNTGLPRSTAPQDSSYNTAMNAHTRFALPLNTHGSLKLLHDKTQANVDNRTDKAINQTAAATTTTNQQRHNSKFSQKMRMLLPGKKTNAGSASEDSKATVSVRKRATTAHLISSHAFVQLGRP